MLLGLELAYAESLERVVPEVPFVSVLAELSEAEVRPVGLRLSELLLVLGEELLLVLLLASESVELVEPLVLLPELWSLEELRPLFEPEVVFCEELARRLWLLVSVELLPLIEDELDGAELLELVVSLLATLELLGEVELVELLESEPLPAALPDIEPEALRPEDELSELEEEELG